MGGTRGPSCKEAIWSWNLAQLCWGERWSGPAEGQAACRPVLQLCLGQTVLEVTEGRHLRSAALLKL